MGDLHDLLEARGRLVALTQHPDRRAVEAAAAYLADEEAGTGFLYSGWCQAALPHKRLPDDASWTLEGDRLTLIVQPGLKPTDQGTEAVGVPYGSRARLIMLYLQSEALRTGSREIELGNSLRAWLTRMGISSGGKSNDLVRDQAERISRCRITFHIKQGSRVGLLQQNIVDQAIFVSNSGEPSLFVETARLSEVFFEQLNRHPVPLEEAAIRAINNNSRALDVYAWLAYRLHALQRPTAITWPAVKAQFGASIGRPNTFRECFIESLDLALAVYPQARVDHDLRGLVLHPSRPPVPPRLTPMGRAAAPPGGAPRPGVPPARHRGAAPGA